MLKIENYKNSIFDNLNFARPDTYRKKYGTKPFKLWSVTFSEYIRMLIKFVR